MKLRDISTPEFRERLARAWPFTPDRLGSPPPALDADTRSVVPAFSIGQRVLAPGTPGHPDSVCRLGGIGTVIKFWSPAPFHRIWHAVALDGSGEEPLLYLPHELKPAPTV